MPRKFAMRFLLGCVAGFVASGLFAAPSSMPAQAPAKIVPSSQKRLIDFTDATEVRARRPLLIAHRGGVVTNKTPECSLGALRAAAEAGYDMIELDIRETKDGVPVIFHDENLRKACGVDTTMGKLTLAEVEKLRYLRNGESIATLQQALVLCRNLNLGVMLDIKEAIRADFVRKIAQLVREHHLDRSTVAISGHPIVRQELQGVALTPVNADELKRIGAGEQVNVQGYYWFGIPSWIPFATIPKLQAAGALVMPAINTFRYESDPDHAKARADVEQLTAIGVDGFQIDSAYQDFFGRALPPTGNK
jgi:glycerophosphoryl diester phosphodiesterase